MDEVKTAPEQEVAQQDANALVEQKQMIPDGPRTIWNDPKQFKVADYMSKVLASSDLVPEGTYKGKPANCLIALEMAQRMGLSPLHVMQNLYIVKGRPAWSGQFCIAVTNGSGRYTPLEFIQLTDENGNEKGWFARATRLSDDKVCDGPPVTWDMVKAEGWLGKNGSKWQTMPTLMFHYRAAAFFVRTFCPDLLCGLQTAEEVKDVRGYDVEKETVTISI